MFISRFLVKSWLLRCRLFNYSLYFWLLRCRLFIYSFLAYSDYFVATSLPFVYLQTTVYISGYFIAIHLTQHRPYIDLASTPHRPYIDPTSTLHRPYINLTSTAHRPYIDLTSTHIDPTSTLHRPLHRPYNDPTILIS